MLCSLGDSRYGWINWKKKILEVINCMSWCLQSDECCDAYSMLAVCQSTWACLFHFYVENNVNRISDRQAWCIASGLHCRVYCRQYWQIGMWSTEYVCAVLSHQAGHSFVSFLWFKAMDCVMQQLWFHAAQPFTDCCVLFHWKVSCHWRQETCPTF